MNFDKFIDDGEGLIIHPPPKEDVNKAEDPEDLEKFNQCHGYRGRFCSSGGGSGGGSSSAMSGPRDESPEERSARDAFNEGRRQAAQDEEDAFWERVSEWEEEQELARPIYSPQSVKTMYTDQVGLSRGEMKFVKQAVERDKERMGITGLAQVNVKHIENDNLAQAGVLEVKAFRDNKYHVVTYVDISPTAIRNPELSPGKRSLIPGQIPWASNSYANNDLASRSSTITHELAHVKMAEHVAKTARGSMETAMGMNGNDAWIVTANKAFEKGWQGPSRYGLKDHAELFAESTVKYLLTGTSGSKDVDKYIEGALKHV